MQLRFFTIPVHGGDEAAEALNRFLGSHRVLAIDRSFVQDGGNSAWSLCVSFEPADGGGRPPSGGKRPYALSGLGLTVKDTARVGHSRDGLTLCGYRILPGRLLLSRRRKRRYAVARRHWEAAFAAGRIDADGVQTATPPPWPSPCTPTRRPGGANSCAATPLPTPCGVFRLDTG